MPEGMRSKVSVGTTRALPLAKPTIPKSWTPKSKRLAERLIAATLPDAHEALAPYLVSGHAWLEAASEELAGLADGRLGPIGHAIIATAAQQYAWSRYWMHHEARSAAPNYKAVEMASRLGDAARLNSTAAYELTLRIAKAMGNGSVDPLDAVTIPASVRNDVPGSNEDPPDPNW